MFKQTVKKVWFTINYRLPIAAKVFIVLYAACALLFVFYKVKESRQEEYILKLKQMAHTGEKFVLTDIFKFKWDEAIYMAGEYSDGEIVRERYGSSYELSPKLDKIHTVLAFFKNGNCKLELRINYYSDIEFSLENSYIASDALFTATFIEDSDAVLLTEIAHESSPSSLNLESIKATNKFAKKFKIAAIFIIILFAFMYFIFFSQYDRLAKYFKKKKCIAKVFLICSAGKPFKLGQEINDIEWDEAKLFTHKYHTGFGSKAEDDYYCVIKRTNNELRNTLVLYKDKKYVFDFAFNTYRDFSFADEFDIMSADTVLIPTKSQTNGGYVLNAQ